MKNIIIKNLLISTISSLLLIIFFVVPELDGIIKNSNDLVTVKNSIFTANAQIKEVDNFKKNIVYYGPNLKLIDTLFFDTKNPVNFVEFLEGIAQDTGVTLKISLSPYSDKQQTAAKFQTLQVTVEGNFSNMINFVKKIELGKYLTEISSLNIENLVVDVKNPAGKDIYANYVNRKVQGVFLIKVFTQI